MLYTKYESRYGYGWEMHKNCSSKNLKEEIISMALAWMEK
jgi:hypothetical protein